MTHLPLQMHKQLLHTVDGHVNRCKHLEAVSTKSLKNVTEFDSAKPLLVKNPKEIIEDIGDNLTTRLLIDPQPKNPPPHTCVSVYLPLLSKWYHHLPSCSN